MSDLLPREEIRVGSKNDPTSSTPVGPYNHGAGGLFSMGGQDPSVFSAILGPVNGLLDYLPVVNADDDLGGQFGGLDSEFMTLLTGVTQGALETFSNQPTTKCADGARAGTMKVCTLVSGFGRYRFSPNAPVNIFDAGRISSRLEPLTLKLLNSPMASNTFGVPTQPGGMSLENTMMNELTRRNFELGMSIQRFMGRRVFIGSPVNNNGEAKDLMGLDIWINAGNKRDAYTSGLCTAADSVVKSFGLNDVTGATYDIQAYAEDMIFNLDWNTSHQGLGMMWDGVIAMRPEAWDVISRVVALRQYFEAYNQAKLFGSNAQIVVGGQEFLTMRNSIRNNQKWPLRGRDIQVVLDDSITEITPVQNGTLKPGSYASTIYFVPLTVMGGIPVTYLKTFDHANTNSVSLANLTGGQSFTTDNGAFRWYINHKNGCIDWTVDFSPRLIMRTPQLAGRIDNVAYTPVSHVRSAFPDSDYFVNGGRTSSPTANYYVAWQATPANLS